MCGIIGYTGENKAGDILLDSLELLEYRGYDSAGIALCDEVNPQPRVLKTAGRVAQLKQIYATVKADQTCGIGHTRWATHGGVCDENAHPHRYGKVLMVHNGIIENYRELVERFHLAGTLHSQTDSEIAAAVLNSYYKGDPYKAIKDTVAVLEGTFAFVIMFEDRPGMIYSVRNVSPIVAAKSEKGCFLASDVTALGSYAKAFFVVPEYHILEMNKEALKLTDFCGKEVEPEYIQIDWELNVSGKNGFPFYMEKEIHQQPQVITSILESKMKEGQPDFSNELGACDWIKDIEQITIIACGTAMHAGLIGQSFLRSLVRIPVDVEMASEYMYQEPIITEKTLVIAVSQSGETIDTLEALKYAKKHGAKVISILNVRGSSISRESDSVIYTDAGPEIAVASTKAYTSQVAVFTLFSVWMAQKKGTLDKEQAKDFLSHIKEVPKAMEQILEQKEKMHHIADQILDAKDIFMIGRGMDYPITLEGSLKLKEVSYIHSEAYAAGELKHGPLALITEGTPVICVATQTKLLSKELSNIREVKSRGAKVILLAKEDILKELEKEDFIPFTLPDTQDEFMPLTSAVALQLLAYYVSLDKGFDVDKPRNLAKVVTVE